MIEKLALVFIAASLWGAPLIYHLYSTRHERELVKVLKEFIRLNNK